jgi:hypothetical protein
MFPKVSIVILNWNSWKDTVECLESVFRIDYPNYQVIVLDNNFPNNSMECIKGWAKGKLDAWIKPNNPLRYLSYSSIKNPVPYVFIIEKKQKKAEIKNWNLIMMRKV